MSAGLCQCGCGSSTSLILRNNAYDGSVAGQYRRFVVGHGNRNPDPTMEAIRKNSKVVKGSGCWEWQGSLETTGYGYIIRSRKKVGVHRLVYELTQGTIPQGLQVRHKCDNRRCCNPKHLEVGTIADNMHDKAIRGRALQGERHHSARLNPEKVRFIRASTLPNVEIATMFGVSASAIRLVRIKKNWKQVL